MNIARTRGIYKLICSLIVFVEATLHSLNDACPGSEQSIQIPNLAGDEGISHVAIGNSDTEEPARQNTGFPKLPDSIVSEITSIPLFNGIRYSDVFKQIRQIRDVSQFAADIMKLKDILLRLDDQQFFDFCMQQSYFPSSIFWLKRFFEKLGIYNSTTFSILRNQLAKFDSNRKEVANSFRLSRIAHESLYKTDKLFALHEKIAQKAIQYFQRTIIEFDNFDAIGDSFSQQINYAEFLTSHETDGRGIMMLRFFKFIVILQQLSIKCSASKKEYIIANSEIIFIKLTDCILGMLKRRAGFMQNIRCLKLDSLTGCIELEFPNPQKLVCINISSENVFDLRGHNLDWILEHRNIKILEIRSRWLLFDTEGFKRLNQMKWLRQMTIVLGRIFNTSVPTSTRGFIKADNYNQPKLIDLCKMEKLQYFGMDSFVLESLSFKRMPELRQFLLKDCSLNSVNLQEMPMLLEVSLSSCVSNLLTLQDTHDLRDLSLVNSSFGSISLKHISKVQNISIKQSLFTTLNILQVLDPVNLPSISSLSENPASNHSTRIETILLDECTFGSINLQGVQSIDHLIVSDCNFSNASSVWGSLAAVKSLKQLVINGHTGLVKLPYEISEINDLELLYLDLTGLDSINVGKYASCTDDVGLNESFRFPKTLRYCSIWVKDEVVGSIPRIWFEKCDWPQLKLLINGCVVTDNY
ncbi:uncharacterized protein VICG_01197 [Vittaforma corneae ATCC 50505]|uniref:F-box domain-containing protein n=1 Tax=Vittaforma corneae (strain ATCC 50505) TaxID=993615 RepID=L2GMW2_VITCO|nr:uncharacterized protein VICG_01197 [Vittaforma corneae ATCC 50505]ELA41845.1 hypothetical protein VICG_01197 [Vittaforma corneae ATCC 50505]